MGSCVSVAWYRDAFHATFTSSKLQNPQIPIKLHNVNINISHPCKSTRQDIGRPPHPLTTHTTTTSVLSAKPNSHIPSEGRGPTDPS